MNTFLLQANLEEIFIHGNNNTLQHTTHLLYTRPSSKTILKKNGENECLYGFQYNLLSCTEHT